MLSRGDILEASNRHKTAGRHYIIYYQGFSEEYFIGGMITGKEKHFKIYNLEMISSFFRNHDSSGIKYKIPSKTSFLVVAKLMKLEGWGPFTKVGELSETGIEFVEATIEHLQSETWEEYLVRSQR